MNTELINVQNSVAAFDKVVAGLTILQEQYGGIVFDVSTTKGLEAAKNARAAVREPRYELERVRKAAKEPLLNLGKQLDNRAKSINMAILEIETPIDDQIKNEETRKEAEKQAKIDAELKRVENIKSIISTIHNMPHQALNRTALEVSKLIDIAESTIIDDSLEEFKEEATAALSKTIIALKDIHTQRILFDIEQERIKTEREELARLRAKQEDRDRKERAQREEQERKDRESQHEREMLLSEINGIKQQAVIAVIGRAGVRKGGTLECARDTLEETKEWRIDAEYFGALFPMATEAKAEVITSIEFHIAALENVQKERAELDRIAAEQAETQRKIDELLKANTITVLQTTDDTITLIEDDKVPSFLGNVIDPVVVSAFVPDNAVELMESDDPTKDYGDTRLYFLSPEAVTNLTPERPSREELITVIAEHFKVSNVVAHDWLINEFDE